jgi:hypothetical protein
MKHLLKNKQIKWDEEKFKFHFLATHNVSGKTHSTSSGHIRPRFYQKLKLGWKSCMAKDYLSNAQNKIKWSVVLKNKLLSPKSNKSATQSVSQCMKLNFASGARHACRRLCVTALMENEPPRWQVESEERHAAARQERSRAAEINFCHSPECALMNELEKRGTNCVIGALNSEKYKTPLAHKHCPPPPLRCIPALLWSPRATRQQPPPPLCH